MNPANPRQNPRDDAKQDPDDRKTLVESDPDRTFYRPDQDTVKAADDETLPPPPPAPSDTVALRVSDEDTKGGTETAESEEPANDTSSHGYPRIEGYEIYGVLGQGGMGVVYEARDLKLNRRVAIKTMHHAITSAESRQRFETEARSLAQVQNAGVVQIYETGELGGAPFLVMELVDGPSLDRVTERKPIDPRLAATIVKKLARTLDICHNKGVVHRDLKPSNVLMEDGKNPRLTDFGLAKLTDEINRVTRTGDIMGTPSYMSPEQASGVVRKIGAPADVYGVGAILYELLTGSPPFSSPDPLNTMMMVLTNAPVSPRTTQPKLSADIETITLKCLEKKAAHRYASCGELADDLERFLSGAPIKAKPTPMYRRVIMWSRRRPAIAALIALCFLGITGAFAGVTAHNAALQNELERSQRIIDESRKLSRWLLEDFTDVLESRDGLTYIRSRLADRTQEHLDALLKDAANDEHLREDLALAFSRLGSLQGQASTGSLGNFEQARQNWIEAERLVGTLKNRKTKVASQTLASVALQRADLAFQKQDTEECRKQLAVVRELLEDESNKLPRYLRKGFDVDATTIEYHLAKNAGDVNAAVAAIDRLKELSDYMLERDGGELEDDEDTAGGKIIALLSWVRAKVDWLEQQSDREERLALLEEARSKVEEIAPPAEQNLNSQTVIANIDFALADIRFHRSEFEQALEIYRRCRDAWADVYGRDAKNHVASYNLGKAWNEMGVCYSQIQEFDETARCYKEADRYYRVSLSLLDADPDTDRHYLYFLGNKGELLMAQGKLDEARATIQKKIDGLSKFPNDLEARQGVGDALVSLGIVEAYELMNAMAADAAEAGEQMKAAHERAMKVLDRAIAHFDQMESEGLINQPARNQRDQARKIKQVLTEQMEKALATLAGQDGQTPDQEEAVQDVQQPNENQDATRSAPADKPSADESTTNESSLNDTDAADAGADVQADVDEPGSPDRENTDPQS